MNIYNMSWFDEDDYGKMEIFYIIVQAVDEKSAKEKAEVHLKEMYNTTIDEIAAVREKFEIKNITDLPVISSGYTEF